MNRGTYKQKNQRGHLSSPFTSASLEGTYSKQPRGGLSTYHPLHQCIISCIISEVITGYISTDLTKGGHLPSPCILADAEVGVGE